MPYDQKLTVMTQDNLSANSYSTPLQGSSYQSSTIKSYNQNALNKASYDTFCSTKLILFINIHF
jgi:hypothetical protein